MDATDLACYTERGSWWSADAHAHYDLNAGTNDNRDLNADADPQSWWYPVGSDWLDRLCLAECERGSSHERPGWEYEYLLVNGWISAGWRLLSGGYAGYSELQ
jgi:hypothetical protein